jgi:hypothetical protein
MDDHGAIRGDWARDETNLQGSIGQMTGKPNTYRLRMGKGLKVEYFTASKYGDSQEGALVAARLRQLELNQELGLIKNKYRSCAQGEDHWWEFQLQDGAEGPFLKVDTEDLEWTKMHTWCHRKDGHLWYADTNHSEGGHRRHHRMVCQRNRLDWPVVDHNNRDGLDNRRANLRDGSGGLNQKNKAKQKNTSGVTGVAHRADRDRWHAYIQIEGMLHQMYFPGAEDDEEAKNAAIAWRKAPKKRETPMGASPSSSTPPPWTWG